MPAVLALPAVQRLLAIPSRRQSSFAGVPAACSLSAATICSSVNLALFASRPPFVIYNAEDCHLRWYSFRGAGHADWPMCPLYAPTSWMLTS